MDDPDHGDQQRRYLPRRSQGRRFEAARVAELYRHRPPYPAEVFDLIDELIGDGPRTILDAGTGPGKIARELVARGYRVDAVDASPEMIRVGRSLPHGDHPALRWIESPIEQAPLRTDYGLAVAGASFHWFDADGVLARLAEVLHPRAPLVVLDGDAAWHAPWAADERELFIAFVAQMDGQTPDWDERDLEQIRLFDHARFDLQGSRVTAPVTVRQSVDDYIACQHSRATFTPETMGPDLAAQFDEALAERLAPHATGGWLSYEVRTRIEWGQVER